MAYRVGFGKLERKMISNERLPQDVQIARIEFKNKIRAGALGPSDIFENRFDVLPVAAIGQRYYEYRVGQATAATAEFPSLAGRRRLVALVDASNKVLRMYFTEDHYLPGLWMELQHP